MTPPILSKVHYFINLSGQRFGRLLIIQYVYTIKKNPYFLCFCDCGNQKIINGGSVRKGYTKSCGCLNSDSQHRIKHKKIKTSEYRSWAQMLQRCNNSNNHKHKSYGARGITVCKRWHKFTNFYKDMGDKPRSGYSIDRINNNGNYEPNNCRWATPKEQSRNTRQNRMITYNGKTQCLKDWADETGIPRPTLSNRINRSGWPIEKALTTPTRQKQQ